MQFVTLTITLSLLFITFIQTVKGHGRLIEPPSRASAWRFGFPTPPDYDDTQGYCGGFTHQYQINGGKCGVCGDAWDLPTPRPHEYGGKFGQGVIVRQYKPGQIVEIGVDLTAHHNGYFEFAVCPDYKTTTQECLDENILRIVKPQRDVQNEGTRYFPREGNKVYKMVYEMPDIECKHCVLQWRYVAGNNWGICPNGTGAVGCGPQEEFRACADIVISHKYIPQIPDRPLRPTRPSTESTVSSTSTTTALPPDSDNEIPDSSNQPAPAYSPLYSFLTSLFSFLAICLLMFLIFFHYYRLGSKFKSWFHKNIDFQRQKEEKMTAPVAPPRGIKKFQMDKTESVA